ncbi:MAG: folylpolyglutamate synthase/dihydrofolate synthase family protein [Calditrichia bacterium]
MEKSQNTYHSTIQYLFDLQYSGIKMGLENVTRLLEVSGNPQLKFPAVHLAGTNGKGSTAVFIYSVLKEHGLRVGLYTSPHLIDFSERIRVNDQLISWETIVKYTQELKPLIEEVNATFFEATSAIAFRYFADREVDIAVVETGLGGRLDATNLVQPLLSVITPISPDHQQFLGEDIRSIAAEKAGIIKAGIPCVTNNTDAGILEVLSRRCHEVGAPFYRLDPKTEIETEKANIHGSCFHLKFKGELLRDLKIGLPGNHQIENAALAAAAVKILPRFKIGEQNLRMGLKRAFWPGRLQIINERPLTILDVAHNIHGFQTVFRFLNTLFPSVKFHILIGLAKDKDYRQIVDVIKGYTDIVGIIKNFSEKELPAGVLEQAFNEADILPTVFDGIAEGFQQFNKIAGANDIILIIGSHYLAGSFLQKYKNVDYK